MARTALSSRSFSVPALVVSLLSCSLVLASAMNADEAGPQEGSTSLFAVFALSMLSLFVFPYTISKVVKAAAPERESRPWEKGTKKSKTARVLSTLLDRKQSSLLWASWALWLLLLLWARGAASGEVAPFDPYEILQVPRGATPAEARRAYRALSLQYHPDKNPDPAAAAYFAESITKAYKALTDEASRENYEKYGHPDGQQSSRMNIALPEWMFSRDGRAAPALLALLIGGGVLAPLMLAAAYLFRSSKHEGPGTISPETIEIFAKSKWCVKEAHSVRSLSADPLVMAYEFIMLATPATQQKPLEELRRTIVDWAPGLKDKQVFWKRRTSIVKVDMLLMAYFARLPVPAELLPDLRYVLTKSPFFLEEMLKIANIPRVYGWPFGWLAPTVGVLETLQCLSVALTPSARRPPPGGAAAAGASGGFFLDAALLALPGVDIDVAKKLARTRKIKTLTDLLLLGGPEERKLALVEAGLVDDDEGGKSSPSSSKAPVPGTVAAVEAAILALPDLAIAKAKAGLGDFDSDDETDDDDDGDDVPRPGDVVTVSCRALLSRRSHTATPDARPPRGKVLPFSPYVPAGLPVTRHERWWVVVGDANSNTCFAVKRVDLRAAEDAAFEARKAGATGINGDAEVLAFVESRMIGKNPEAGASAEVKAGGAAAAGKKKGSNGSSPSSNALVSSSSSSSLSSMKPPPPARANTMGPYAMPQASNANAAAAAAEHGARFEVQFEAPPRPGKYNLTLMLLCDSSVGGDRAMPLRLRVAQQSRAEREGRNAAQQAAARAAKKKKEAAAVAAAAAAAAAAAKGKARKSGKAGSEITVASEDGGGAAGEGEATSDDGDDEAAVATSSDEDAAAAGNSSSDEDDEEEGNGEWDSEESGTEASGVSESESEAEEEEEESSDEEEAEEESSSAEEEEEEDDSSAAATSTRPSTGATTTTAASSDDDEEEEEEEAEEDEEAEETSSGEEEDVEAEEESSEEGEEATPSPAAAPASADKAAGKPAATRDAAVAAE